MINWNSWNGLDNIPTAQFVCGFCGDKVGSQSGYFHQIGARIYICPNCGYPTFINEGIQYPGPLLGRQIGNLPEDIGKIYLELREVIKNANYTSALLLGRKLIMHLAVDVAKAKEGESFVAYITHLQKANYIPPNAESWLVHIKDLGNEKNHELKIGTKDEAERVSKFIEALLIFMYEFSENPVPSVGSEA